MEAWSTTAKNINNRYANRSFNAKYVMQIV